MGLRPPSQGLGCARRVDGVWVSLPPFPIRQDPAQRMAVILVAEDTSDFDKAWEAAWDAMCHERAWPHSTRYRHAWKAALVGLRDECAVAVREGGSLDVWVSACRDRKDVLLAGKAAKG